MIVRKLFVVIAILSGLFAFQGSMAAALPVDKPRTEIVVSAKANDEISIACKLHVNKARKLVVRETLQKAQVVRPQLSSLLLSTIYFHSSL